MSKLLMFDWRCTQCEHEFHDLAKSDKHELPCPACGGTAKRLISKPRFPLRQGVDADMPTAAARWDKVHQKGREVDERRAKDNGPDSWGADGGDVRR